MKKHHTADNANLTKPAILYVPETAAGMLRRFHACKVLCFACAVVQPVVKVLSAHEGMYRLLLSCEHERNLTLTTVAPVKPIAQEDTSNAEAIAIREDMHDQRLDG